MTVATGTALLPAYARFPVTFVDGDGCWLIADDGRRFLDCIAGIAVVSLGHCHPAPLEAAKEQLDKARTADPPAPWWVLAWFTGVATALEATDAAQFDAAIHQFETIVDPAKQPRRWRAADHGGARATARATAGRREASRGTMRGFPHPDVLPSR